MKRLFNVYPVLFRCVRVFACSMCSCWLTLSNWLLLHRPTDRGDTARMSRVVNSCLDHLVQGESAGCFQISELSAQFRIENFEPFSCCGQTDRESPFAGWTSGYVDRYVLAHVELLWPVYSKAPATAAVAATFLASANMFVRVCVNEVALLSKTRSKFYDVRLVEREYLTSQRDSARAHHVLYSRKYYFRRFSVGQLCGSTILFRTGTVLSSYVSEIHCFHPAPLLVDITACLSGARNSRGDSAMRKYEVRLSAIENCWSTTCSQRDGSALVVFAHFFLPEPSPGELLPVEKELSKKLIFIPTAWLSSESLPCHLDQGRTGQNLSGTRPKT